jgi:hypothetical protein
MTGWQSLGLVLSICAAGCYRSDPCLANAQVHRFSPSGRREATIYRGDCPGVFLAPQVTVEFKDAGGGAGVFALADSVGELDARWHGEDTLEVSYPATAHPSKQDSVGRFRSEVLHIVYSHRG